jgi:hypothetical protein
MVVSTNDNYQMPYMQRKYTVRLVNATLSMRLYLIPLQSRPGWELVGEPRAAETRCLLCDWTRMEYRLHGKGWRFYIQRPDGLTNKQRRKLFWDTQGLQADIRSCSVLDICGVAIRQQGRRMSKQPQRSTGKGSAIGLVEDRR